MMKFGTQTEKNVPSPTKLKTGSVHQFSKVAAAAILKTNEMV
jgi:hypothetical protein